jgi:nucleoside-diphosphate-sugar epimerase
VTALVSSADSAARLSAKPYAVLAADASSLAELRTKFSGYGKPDVLVHCLSGHGGRDAAAYRLTYVETLKNLQKVLQPGFSIFTSSTSVYPQNDGSVVTEESPVGGTPTGDVLLEAEHLALTAGGAVVRLGGIYGPGRSRFIQAALAGQPLPHGSPDAFSNLIHRDDAASALFHVGRKVLPGTFNAVDDSPARRRELAEAIRLGSVEPLQHPAALPPATGKRVGNAKLRATGWSLRYPSVVGALRQDADLRASIRPGESG